MPRGRRDRVWQRRPRAGASEGGNTFAASTHPNNIGHDDFLGCFRCHDGKHKSSDGRVISDDCAACHNVLAMEEKQPKVLADLGVR